VAFLFGLASTLLELAPIPFVALGVWVFIAFTHDLRLFQAVVVAFLMMVLTVVSAAVLMPLSETEGKIGGIDVQASAGSASQEDYRYEKATSSLEQIAFALEDYIVENQHYPGALDLLIDPKNPYIGFLPKDPYSQNRNEPFVYKTNGEKWVLVSRGPDGDFDFDPDVLFDSEIDKYEYLGGYFRFPRPGARYLYDPVNGPVSNGDIIRAGPK